MHVSQPGFWLLVVLIIIIVVYFSVNRKSEAHRKMSFNFRKRSDELPDAMKGPTPYETSKTSSALAKKDSSQYLAKAEKFMNEAVVERNLQVFFNHNQHTWEAHEVLGLPAGCPRPLIEQNYAHYMKSRTAPNSGQSAEFMFTSNDDHIIQMAFDALLRR